LLSKRLKQILIIKYLNVFIIVLIIILVGLACNMKRPTVTPEKDPDVANQIDSVPTQNFIDPASKTTEPLQNDSDLNPSDTPFNNPMPVNESTQPVANEINIVGGWYGPACDEGEGTFIYRWSVDLMKDPTTGRFIGVAKFHDCPGGGRVSYYLTGEPQESSMIFLSGEKTASGGGNLFSSSDQTINFTFDLTSGILSPNLTP